MKQITTLSRTLIVVPVPKGLDIFYISAYGFLCSDSPLPKHVVFNEPIGEPEQLQLIGTLSTLTGELVKEFVEREWANDAYWYKDYYDGGMLKQAPLKSFKTLLKSHGVNTDEEVLVIEKVKELINSN